MKDVTKFNTVIGFGTTIHNFVDANGKYVFLPFVYYHLPTTAVQLLSPQNYHQLHIAHYIIKVFSVKIALKNHNIITPINRQEDNLSIIYNSYVTSAQYKRNVTLLRLSMVLIGLDYLYLFGYLRTDTDSSGTEGEVVLNDDLYNYSEICGSCFGYSENQNVTDTPERISTTAL